jgi:hypothetical protein
MYPDPATRTPASRIGLEKEEPMDPDVEDPRDDPALNPDDGWKPEDEAAEVLRDPTESLDYVTHEDRLDPAKPTASVVPWKEYAVAANNRCPTWDTLPCDVTPFNEMASLFGAAGTVLGFLQQEGHYRVTKDQLARRVQECFINRDEEFKTRVVQIIVQYFENHRDDAANWDKDVERYKRQLEAGQIKVIPPTTWRGL